MNTFRAGKSRLSPGFIVLLASQLENLALEPHQEPIVRHLMQGKSISEVAAITGEPLWDVMINSICVSSLQGRAGLLGAMLLACRAGELHTVPA